MRLPTRVAAIVGDLREEPERLSTPTSLAEAMERRRIPGVALAVIADGRVDWAGGFGIRNADRPEPVTEDTIFQAGSISKPVAALCGLRLVAEGRLDLDQDVNERLTSWLLPPIGSWQPRVTLRQLLSHTAGLTIHGFPGYRRDESAPDLVGVLEGTGNTAPVLVRTIPGLQFSYSGGGYCVLQQLLIDVTGERFPDLARRLVLEPLGMRASTYEQPLPEDLRANAAAGHRTGGKLVDGGWHVYPEMAAAGLWTNAADLARFVLAIQASHAGAEHAILPPELVDELLSERATNVPMGLGLLLQGEGGTRRFGHGGDDQGFVARMVGYVEEGFGAVVMTNSDSGLWLIDPLIEAVGRAYSWPDYPGSREPELRDPTDAEAEPCVGSYVSAGGDRFLVSRGEPGLLLTFGGQPPIELAASTATDWHALSLAINLTFEIGSSGRAERARLHQDAEYVEDLELTRVK